MWFVETYGKEIVSVAAALLTWALNRFFKAKAKLQFATPHAFTFLVQEPLKNAEGNVVLPTQTVRTQSIMVKS